MKTVFNNAQLCHVFASQSQEHGKNGNGTLYFQDNIIYSYGSHYVLGAYHKDQDILLVNEYSYSPTTGQHSSTLMRAFNYKGVYVPYPAHANEKQKELNAKYLSDKTIETYLFFLKGRTVYSHCLLEGYLKEVKEYNKFIKIFKLKNFKPIKVTFDFIKCWIGQKIEKQKRMKELEATKEVRNAKKIELERKRIEKRSVYLATIRVESIAAFKELRVLSNDQKDSITNELTELVKELRPNAIKAFKNNEKLNSYQVDAIRGDILLRIDFDKKVVFTSEFAEVPLSDAFKSYRLLKLKRNLVGSKIGHFTVDALETDKIPPTLKIGCHDILLSEIDSTFEKYLDIWDLLQLNNIKSPNEIAEYTNSKNLNLSSGEIVFLSDNS